MAHARNVDLRTRMTNRANYEPERSSMNSELESMAANAICHAARMAGAAWTEAAYDHCRPSVLYRPALSIDGNKWCALYGDNLQDGVAGFGDSPDAAMRDFDEQWRKPLKRTAPSEEDV